MQGYGAQDICKYELSVELVINRVHPGIFIRKVKCLPHCEQEVLIIKGVNKLPFALGD